jgi:hypothetical protein
MYLDIVSSPQSKKPMEKKAYTHQNQSVTVSSKNPCFLIRTVTNVAGKKIMPRVAMDFMRFPSRRVSWATSRFTWESMWLTELSSCFAEVSLETAF